MKNLYRVVLSYACAGVITNGKGLIIESAPIFHWAVGKKLSTFKEWVIKKHGKFHKVKRGKL